MKSEPGENSPNLTELVDEFREIKHDLNNSFGVLMALCELADRDPKHLTKLSEVIMQRSPQIVQRLQAFGDRLRAAAAPR